MGIVKVLKYFLIVLPLINFGALSAKNFEMPDYGLYLSPESCVILNNTKQCEVIVSIQWKVTNSGNYCLYTSQQNTPIECWQEQNQATKELLIIVEQDIHFELRQQVNNIVIYKKSLKMYRKVTNLRRKRRNPWSFY